ncbi:MAG TPA: response regulator [Blastocatellia bacterium]|nr:response regulator [Blastocatellia bacterium]
MRSPKNKILLVDDNHDNCEMITLLLGFAGYQVSSAYTMVEGWRMVRDNHFDLCLLDNLLPDGSGYELCQQICLIYPQLPVMFYSGDAYDNDRNQGLAAGAKAYLVKPNDLEKIAEVIDTLLQASE